MKKLICLSLVASSFLLADTDLEQLKTEMDKQQLIMQELIKKIEKLEQTSAYKEQENEYTNEIHSHATHESSELFEHSKYIPDISFIADFSYVNRNKKDSEITHLEVPGVVHGLLGSHSDGDITHSTYNANNGFNLNYAELSLSSEINSFFNLDTTFHFNEYGVEIEEAFFKLALLNNGLNIKGGKFLSNFGYINNIHNHEWSFSDMPLVYESFLGIHGINEIGLQLQWIAPISTYLMFGTEVLQGENEQMFGTKTIGDAETPIAKGSNTPSLFMVYVKSSIDIDNTTILAGISYAKGGSRLDHSSEEEPSAFSGDSKLYGVDLFIKHHFDSYSFLSWQSEWLMRDMDGTEYTLDPNNTTVVTSSANLSKKQAGLYTQLEYGINKNWKTAVRYDTIYKNNVVENGINLNEPKSLNKYSAMIEYQTNEFAKFRLQYNHNEALYNEDSKKQKINTLILQANITIGTHEAH